ncbi:hypothetical protein ACU686_14890 [Yinghuangia aomiensis]
MVGIVLYGVLVLSMVVTAEWMRRRRRRRPEAESEVDGDTALDAGAADLERSERVLVEARQADALDRSALSRSDEPFGGSGRRTSPGTGPSGPELTENPSCQEAPSDIRRGFVVPAAGAICC